MKYSYTLLILCIYSTVVGQVSGYQGKRWILKTDVLAPILERGATAEVEYITTRFLGITSHISYSADRFKQILPGYKLRKGEDPTEKAQIADFQFGLGTKIYFNNVLPAPKRNYFFARILAGRTSIKGNYFIFDEDNPNNEFYQAYSVKNVPTVRTAIGFGYQTVVFNFVVLDFDLGIATGALLLDNPKNDADYNYLTQGFSDRYGPNIYSFGNWRQGKAGGMGLNANFKIGILLGNKK
jgi:hypothetical protein